MPRPPVLPVIDWKKVFDSGIDYFAWIAGAENKDHAIAMETAVKGQKLDAQTVAYLGALPRPVYVVAIAEDWCGDVVRHVPVLQRLAQTAPQLKVRYITRQQHPDVFVRFLTNGGEAIPKFVFLSEQFTECGSWGPMPGDCRELIARGKVCGDVGAARKKVSALYEMDAEKRTVVTELIHLIDTACCATP